jgi:hypothetical protein
MFIIWGKKAVYRNLGYVADFCTTCRCPRPFGVRRIGMAGHVYYITAGQGELVGFDRTCEECGTPYRADPSAYKSIAKTRGPIDSLVRETFPNLAEVWGERIALEAKLKSGASTLTPEERGELIREPFLRLSPKVEARYASTHFDKEVGFAVLGAIALLIIGPAFARTFTPDQEEPIFLTSLTLGALLVIWQIMGVGRRFLHRQILPTLAVALKPLGPTESELKSILSELKAHGHKIGAKLKAAEVSSSLASGSQANATRS